MILWGLAFVGFVVLLFCFVLFLLLDFCFSFFIFFAGEF